MTTIEQVDQLQVELNYEMEQALREVRDQLQEMIAELEVDENGNIKTDSAINIQRVNKAARTLRDELERRGISDARARLAEGLQRVSGSILSELGELGLPSTFTTSSQSVMSALIDGADKALTDAIDKGAGTLQQVIRVSSLGGAPPAKLISEVSKELGSTLSQAKTAADTATMGFARTMKVKHSRDHGVTMFGYDGPLDSVTRPWCAMWVDRKGTPREIEATGNKHGRDRHPPGCLAFGGGYRCRHEWNPINQINSDDYKRGPRTDAEVAAIASGRRGK